LNIVEKVTGRLIPLSEVIFSCFNPVPVVFLFVLEEKARAEPIAGPRKAKPQETRVGREACLHAGDESQWLDIAYL
jgi:short subunit fatty acids transporter